MATRAARFIEEHKQTLRVDRHSDAPYLWRPSPREGGRWEKLSSADLEAYIERWLCSAEGQVAEAAGEIRKQVLDAVRGSIDGAVVMDSDPLLLGVGDDVVELRTFDVESAAYTAVLRHARPSDLVSKSVGYDVPEGGFSGSTAKVESFFAQVYPAEEDRRFFQLFGGYCLLGSQPAEGCLCLTDGAGATDSGKSSALLLLRHTLGPDYTLEGPHDLLYASRNRGLNDAGMLDFEGKRLLAIDELGGDRVLDAQVVRQLLGLGSEHLVIRDAFSPRTRTMQWCTKLAMVGGPPLNLNDTDEDIAEHAYELRHGTTFDSPKLTALLAEPWKLLAWFLEGLERYWNIGRRELHE